jgi:hypothetical protein
MYELGLFDIVEALSVLSSTFCGPVLPAWASPSPVRGPATALQPYIYEAMRSFSVAAETIPMWLQFLDDHTADVAFLIGPATLSTPSFQAEGDTSRSSLGSTPLAIQRKYSRGECFARTTAGPSHAKRCCRFSSGLISRRRPIHSG